MHMPQASRVDWVDYAKGFCIVMVVMMHSTLGVEAATGQESWMHALVAFAKPFRMPDFFLISGLFLARVIDRDWRTYIDRKVVHFVYFYILWVTIQFAFKAPGLMFTHGLFGIVKLYAEAFIEPFGTLWFIYLLPIFFVATKALRGVSPVLIWLVAAALEIAPIHTGWTVPDEFAARFVYFYTGYLMAKHVLAFAADVDAHKWRGLIGLAVWGTINATLVIAGRADMPFVSLALGLSGAMAVITVAVLISRISALEPVRYCGQNSIVIYLAFFLPMGVTRTLLLKTGIVPDIGAVALIVTLAGVIGALTIWWCTRHTRLSFLFVRPQSFRLASRPAFTLQPAE